MKALAEGASAIGYSTQIQRVPNNRCVTATTFAFLVRFVPAYSYQIRPHVGDVLGGH